MRPEGSSRQSRADAVEAARKLLALGHTESDFALEMAAERIWRRLRAERSEQERTPLPSKLVLVRADDPRGSALPRTETSKAMPHPPLIETRPPNPPLRLAGDHRTDLGC